MPPRATPTRSNTQPDNANEPAARSPDRDRESPSLRAPRRTTHRATRTQPQRNAAAARRTRSAPTAANAKYDEPTVRVVPRTTRLDRPRDRRPPARPRTPRTRRRRRRPRSDSRGGRQAQPTAATTTAGTPIQNSRDWLDPSLKKSAAKLSPAAATPQATGRRIAREANRAVGRIQETPVSRSNTNKWRESRLQSAYN